MFEWLGKLFLRQRAPEPAAICCPEPATISYRISLFGNEGRRTRSVDETRPEPKGDHEFYGYIAGVRFNNSDGSSRQEIIETGVRLGDTLGFRIEQDNPKFPSAVAVLAPNGRQVGYLSGTTGLAEDVRKWVEKGCQIRLTVKEITRATSGNALHRLKFLIQVYEEQPEEEEQRLSLEAQILEELINKSGHFVVDKIPSLILILFGERKYSYGKLVHSALDYGGEPYTFLTANEKRAFGLNTRKKYTKELISYFISSSLPLIEPKAELYRIQTDAFHRARRRCTLIKMRKLGFISNVSILSTEGCRAIQNLQHPFPISCVPDLPLTECDGLCLCSYEPVRTGIAG